LKRAVVFYSRKAVKRSKNLPFDISLLQFALLQFQRLSLLTYDLNLSLKPVVHALKLRFTILNDLESFLAFVEQRLFRFQHRSMVHCGGDYARHELKRIAVAFHEGIGSRRDHL